MMVPVFELYPPVSRFRLPSVMTLLTAGTFAKNRSARRNTASARSTEAPSGNSMLARTSPWSSAGTKPDGSARNRPNAARVTSPRQRRVVMECRMRMPTQRV